LIEVARVQAADVGGEVRLGARQAAEARELQCAEVVRVVLLRPRRHLRVQPEIGPARTPLTGTDPVAPVIAVGEAAAWPADHRRLDFLERVDERRPDTTGVRNLRVFADPHAVVDNASKMLRKMAVQLGRDGPQCVAEDDVDPRVGGARGARRDGKSRATCDRGAKEVSSGRHAADSKSNLLLMASRVARKSSADSDVAEPCSPCPE
jgi:hypothetical protein